jgi:hypothetical protein
MKKILSLVAALSLMLPAVSNASLTLNIDTANDQLWFTGSDTGSSAADDEDNVITWLNASVGEAIGINNLDISSLLTFNDWTASIASFYVIQGVNSTSGIEIILDGDSAGNGITITGNGAKIDYSGLGATYVSLLESYATATSMSLSEGSGFSSITVVAAAVPEPAYFAGLAGLGALGAVLVYRRRQCEKTN